MQLSTAILRYVPFANGMASAPLTNKTTRSSTRATITRVDEVVDLRLEQDVLAKAVEKTFHSWHTAKKLDTFYRLKSAVLRDIKKVNGGNTVQHASLHR